MARRPQINDLRRELPVHESRRFARRAVSDIRGVVFHQTLGDYSVTGIAKYHVSEECHIAPGVGCPGICYTYFVDTDGTIYLCNDHEAVTWSQAGSTAPLPMTRGNTNYLAVVFRGDFAGKDHKGGEPTEAQLESARALWEWLRADLALPEDMLFGHFDFGKPACPGNTLSKLIADVCAEGLDVKGNLPRSIEDWQRGLVDLGYDLGTWGENKDGVDGDWGDASRRALLAFQADEGLGLGDRDAPTATRLATRLAEVRPKKKSRPKTRARKTKGRRTKRKTKASADAGEE